MPVLRATAQQQLAYICICIYIQCRALTTWCTTTHGGQSRWQSLPKNTFGGVGGRDGDGGGEKRKKNANTQAGRY